MKQMNHNLNWHKVSIETNLFLLHLIVIYIIVLIKKQKR